MLRLTLKRFLRAHGLSEEDLADAIAETIGGSRAPVSERHLRYLSRNSEPLTPENAQRKPSLVMLGLIIRGLRHLTGENVRVSDLLEYLPDAGEAVPNLGEARSELVALSAEEEASFLLLARLTRARLSACALSELLIEPRIKARRVPSHHWLIVTACILSVGVSVGLYERFSVRPRLLLASGLFSFRDRLRATSDLDVPSLIGPEGETHDLSPVLRASPVPGTSAYEFYVENLISDDAVYTGPVPQNSFLIPEGTLCPDTPYAWRVRALGADGWTSFSSPLTFSVSADAPGVSSKLLRLSELRRPPGPPVMLAPQGSAASLTPELVVADAPDALGYGFYIRDLTSDRVIYNNNFAASPVVKVSAGLLVEGGVYQWNARSRNCHYWSAFTPAQVFTVSPP